MIDPFRLKVLKAVVRVLKSITPENGFQHNLADEPAAHGKVIPHVYRGVTRYGQNHKLPLVSVLEHPAALEPASMAGDGAQDRKGDWAILIQGFVKDDPENPTDPAHYLVADVIKALAAEANKSGGRYPRNYFDLGDREPCVTAIKIGSPVVRPADGEISDQAFFWLTLTLTLVEDPEKPFA